MSNCLEGNITNKEKDGEFPPFSSHFSIILPVPDTLQNQNQGLK